MEIYSREEGIFGMIPLNGEIVVISTTQVE
jgi:hypothetical protein